MAAYYLPVPPGRFFILIIFHFYIHYYLFDIRYLIIYPATSTEDQSLFPSLSLSVSSSLPLPLPVTRNPYPVTIHRSQFTAHSSLYIAPCFFLPHPATSNQYPAPSFALILTSHNSLLIVSPSHSPWVSSSLRLSVTFPPERTFPI